MAPPSSPQASAPLWLKVLVIVMGLLIVVGFVVVAAEIARRMSSASTPPARQPPARRPSPSASPCPRARRSSRSSAAGDRVAVHVKAADGRSTLYIVDPRNGALLGTVEFPPGAAR